MPPKSSSEELAGVWEAVYGGLLVSQHAQGPLNLWTFLLTTEASINLARATPQPQAYWVKTINSDEVSAQCDGVMCAVGVALYTHALPVCRQCVWWATDAASCGWQEDRVVQPRQIASLHDMQLCTHDTPLHPA